MSRPPKLSRTATLSSRRTLVAAAFVGLLLFVALTQTRRASLAGRGQEAAASSCVAPPAGMVAWYPGDGNANDIQGGNNGTLQGGVTFATGLVGQAFNFNGVDGQVVVPHNANQNVGSQITIDAWVNPSSSGHGRTILQKRSASNVGGYVFETVGQPFGPDNGLQWVIMIGGTYRSLITPTGVLTLNTWQHVAATYDGATMRIYVNGVVVSSMAQTGAIDATTDPIVIGRNVVNPSSAWQGLIDEVELYNRALSQSEIQSIFNAGSAGKCKPSCVAPPSGLVSWYPGDGNANDIQGGNSGTLQNGVTFVNGKVGQAFHFNGTNQFVQTSNAANLSFERTNAFSLDAWVRTTNTAQNEFIAAKELDSSPYTGYYLALDNGSAPQCDNGNPPPAGAGLLTAYLEGSDTHGCQPAESLIQVRGTTKLNDGSWHHVAMSYDGSSSASGVKLYVDGTLENTITISDNLGTHTIQNTAPFTIGSRENGGGGAFNGDIDEVDVFNRALSQSEIQSIFNASSAGKCKAASSCVAPPTGLVSWYQGDGNSLDYQGGNHGSVSGTVTFVPGKVGQAFNFDGGGSVDIQDSVSLRPPTLTLDAWVKPDFSNRPRVAFDVDVIFQKFNNPDGYVLFITEDPNTAFVGSPGGLPNGTVGFQVEVGGTLQGVFSSTPVPNDGQFHHVAATYDGSNAKLYLDGASVGTLSAPGQITHTTAAASIGALPGRASHIAIDEVDLFNRALSQSEIQSIAGAGGAGKCKTKPTPTPTPAPPSTVTISGRVTDVSGQGIGNVMLTMTGTGTGCRVFTNGACSVLTDASGNYAFRSLTPSTNNTITITPTKTNVSFQPASRTLNNVSSDQSNVNFAGTLAGFTISGKVTASGLNPSSTNPSAGLGLSGLTIQMTGFVDDNSGRHPLNLTTQTDSSGQYAFRNLPPGTVYTVNAPFIPGYDIAPAQVSGTLTQNAVADFTATRSSSIDSGRIAFVGDDGICQRCVFVMNGDGTGLKRIYPSDGDIQQRISVQFGGPGSAAPLSVFGAAGQPSWSRDGTKLVFTISSHLYTMSFDGGNLKPVGRNPGASQDDGLRAAYPTWNKDGTKIAFEDGGVIFTIDADGKNLKRVGPNAVGPQPTEWGQPDWSPDGTRIAFSQTSLRGFRAISAMSADGSNVVQLSSGTGVVPAWSPSGANIAYKVNYDTGYISLISGSASNQSKPETIGYGAGGATKPAWSPDGKKIVVSGGTVLDVVGKKQLPKLPVGFDPTWATNVVGLQVSPSGTVTAGNVTVRQLPPCTGPAATCDPLFLIKQAELAMKALQGGVEACITATSCLGHNKQPVDAYTLSLGNSGRLQGTKGVEAADNPSPITTCFTEPSINDRAVFNSLRVLHLEDGAFVDRTILAPAAPAPDFSTRQICASTTSLGSFVVVQQADQSLPAIDGLVNDSNGNPLADVDVVLGGDRTFLTRTDSNGRFSFINLQPGGNYTVAPVRQGSFSFTPQSQSVTNIQADQTLIFSASTCGLSLSTQSAYFAQAGGAGGFQINAASTGCGWVVSTDAPWLTITSPTSGGGASGVQFQVAANDTGFNRVATIDVDGQTIQVTQTATDKLSDDSAFYVRQHYLDFLSREADASGLDFWTNNIESCGANAQCREVKRIDTSAAFFLSIEFQQTGYLVERMYKSAYGDATGNSTFGGAHTLAVPVVRLSEFLADSRAIGQGVVVLQPGWEQQLEANKQAFAAGFVARPRFTSAFPVSMTPAQFVDKLNQNAGGVLSAGERAAAINLFGGAADTSDAAARAKAVRQVAESQVLSAAEFDRAFVLMQYFGYLRRNPNDAPDSDYTGYDFWLRKLDQFGGNYIQAEMVRAFISSFEYQGRFGPR